MSARERNEAEQAEGDETGCPYCTSRVTITTLSTGMLEVRHHELYGPQCEAGLQRLMAEETAKAGMKIMFRN